MWQRKGKYNARKTQVDGMTFDSLAEANRYFVLKMLVKAGEISDLEMQVKFPLTVNGKKIGSYIADFRYKDQSGNIIVEDVKGVKTAVYNLKKKLVAAIYGIDILETA